ncbi:hypothetical protein L0P88_08845 [Muricauda sp. SCSIO 64092]|uniref:hypothetical protein n=1 Tax=Allomuricauda sp. SCSIO 64092 TaxID=2908842 RepID=UPI001FF4F494|nr:hypothetical protein [Muricauda sp. SCSIO 64092]UOY08646.1 hypothetical protein L0P88_08845 [Muricauda sp. SCSIO 64092]
MLKTSIKILFFFGFNAIVCYSQSIDTIYVNYNQKRFEEIAKDSLESRYAYTVKNFMNSSQNADSIYLLPNYYKLDSLKAYVVPELNLNKEKLKNYSCHSKIEELIDFNFSEERLKIIVEHKDSIIAAFRTKFYNPKNGYPKIMNAILYEDYENPIRLNKGGLLNKLRLEKRYFSFDLKGFSKGRFIIDKEQLFFVFTEGPENVMKKINANEFIRTHIGKKGIRHLKKNGFIKNNIGYNPCKKTNGDLERKTRILIVNN